MPTTTTQSGPPPWMVPYLQDYMDRAQDQANVEYEASPSLYTGPNQTLRTGWNTITNRALDGSPLVDAASGQLQNFINGGGNGTAAENANANLMNPYANAANPYTGMNNPYLEQSISNAQGDLTRAYNNVQKPAWDTAMQRSGSFGNSGVALAAAEDRNNLQQNLGRIGTDMRNAAYNQSAGLAENQLGRQFTAGSQNVQNRFNAGEGLAGRQDSMFNNNRDFQFGAIGAAIPFANQDYVDAGQLLNVGNQMQNFNQAQAQQNYNWWQEANQFPQNQLDAYGRALGLNTGNTQTSTSPGVPRFNSALGGALTGYQLGNGLFGGGGGTIGGLLGGLGGWFG